MRDKYFYKWLFGILLSASRVVLRIAIILNYNLTETYTYVCEFLRNVFVEQY